MNNGRPNDGGGEPEAPRPRAPRGGSLPLALKADVVLGAQLVSRHRSPRLAAVLVLALLVAAAGQRPAPGPARAPLAVVAAGVMVAVAASRLFAPGGALAASRAAAARWWVAPVGRLTGALVLTLPLAVAAAALLVLPGAGVETAVRVSAAVILYGAALAAVTAALTPLLGSSVAASVGLMSAWLGAIPPTALAALLGAWPLVARPLVWLWNVLPLPWRAIRWLSHGNAQDPVMLVVWGVLGALVVGWSAERFYRVERQETAA